MSLTHLSLNDWLDLLQNRHQQEIQLGLERVLTVARELKLHELNAPVVTVAGTNGKGSTAKALEAVYTAAGYSVACYNSPHLIHFNERIRVDGVTISDQKLIEAFMFIENGRKKIDLTYFETVTLAAFWYFKQHKLDIVILEVGMGGRLDATNIIDPDLAIITTVDFDHQAYLGETIDAIGYEKAGILRLNQPFIYADKNPPDTIIKRALELNAFRIEYSFETTSQDLIIHPLLSDVIKLPLPKIHPGAAAAAIMATHTLQQILPITYQHWVTAMIDVAIIGRQQILEGPVKIMFDVAHNPQAVNLLAIQIKKIQPKAKVHAVFSGLKDKDLCGLISIMHPEVDAWYPCVLTDKRASSIEQLAGSLKQAGVGAQTIYSSPIEAFNEARQNAVLNDLIVVFGSFVLVGAIMAAQSLDHQELP
jgi:dihydrofolate synthase/folylpolyglutamate synthase